MNKTSKIEYNINNTLMSRKMIILKIKIMFII